MVRQTLPKLHSRTCASALRVQLVPLIPKSPTKNVLLQDGLFGFQANHDLCHPFSLVPHVSLPQVFCLCLHLPFFSQLLPFMLPLLFSDLAHLLNFIHQTSFL